MKIISNCLVGQNYLFTSIMQYVCEQSFVLINIKAFLSRSEKLLLGYFFSGLMWVLPRYQIHEAAKPLTFGFIMKSSILKSGYLYFILSS